MSTVEKTANIVSVQAGRVAPLGPRRVQSGFVKRPIVGAVMVKRLGLVGDEQADLRVHGGPDKAIYCYPIEHYSKWLAEHPTVAALLVPGGFGENLTIRGYDENSVCVGDVMRIGSVTAQVTQPRRPCYKLGLRFSDPRILAAMAHTGRTGWYLRVLEPGLVQAGASITLIDRLNPAWTIARLNRLITSGGTFEELSEVAELCGLPAGIRESARAALEVDSGAALRRDRNDPKGNL